MIRKKKMPSPKFDDEQAIKRANDSWIKRKPLGTRPTRESRRAVARAVNPYRKGYAYNRPGRAEEIGGD